jgi:hypothetical protein
VSDLHLPSLLAQDTGQLAAAIVERHGGRERLSVLDYEIVLAVVKTLQAMRAAAPADLPRLVESLSKLEAMLPGAAGSGPARSPLQQLHDHCAGVPS